MLYGKLACHRMDSFFLFSVFFPAAVGVRGLPTGCLSPKAYGLLRPERQSCSAPLLRRGRAHGRALGPEAGSRAGARATGFRAPCCSQLAAPLQPEHARQVSDELLRCFVPGARLSRSRARGAAGGFRSWALGRRLACAALQPAAWHYRAPRCRVVAGPFGSAATQGSVSQHKAPPIGDAP